MALILSDQKDSWLTRCLDEGWDRDFHSIDTDDDYDNDDNDATGENLGKHNVYRKLSNSALPQCSPLPVPTCWLHCAPVPVCPHSTLYPAALFSTAVPESTQTGCPYFAHYLQWSGSWWHWSGKIKQLNCVGNAHSSYVMWHFFNSNLNHKMSTFLY